MEKYQYDPRELALIEGSAVPVAVYQFIDRRVVTLALSDGFCELFGFDDKAEAYFVMDNDMYRDAHPDDVARIADIAFRFATEGGEYNAVYRTRVGDDYIIVHALGRHIYTKTGERLAVVWYADEGAYTAEGAGFENRLNETLNLAMRENTHYHENHFDSLTGLPGMTYFYELAEAGNIAMRARGERPAMLFFDLCGMKLFNRNNGFAEGDKLIRAVAKVLVGHFSSENCSRFAQDHFAVFTAYTPALEDTLEEIFEECRHINDGMTLPVRVGIYLAGAEKLEVGAACDRAKAACDTSRKSYVSTFTYFKDSMMTDALYRQHIIDDLDKAIEEKRIDVYYQSIVRAANGRVCNEEVLARWMDTDRGLLAPAEFIPVLEEAGLVYKLDLYVLETLLEKLSAQGAIGNFVVPTSINLSRSDFDSCDIVEEIRRRVDSSGLPRSVVCIEITESVIGSDTDFMAEQIGRFRDLGFQVWMDDFGSGYSSLDLLQTIDFDLIKFDMHFMQKFNESENSRIILTELMKMALSMGVETIVEGVETKEQAEFLREIGCTKLQGFYYTRPLPLPVLIDRYRKKLHIPFENPEEAEYYAAVGAVNLFNPGVVSDDSTDLYRQYFDTLPMAVLEVQGDEVTIVRCNQSYRDMLPRVFGLEPPEGSIHNLQFDQQPELDFFDAVRQSSIGGEWVQFDRRQENSGYDVHCFVRRVAVNPVTDAIAVADIVLAMRHAQLGAPDDSTVSTFERELQTVSANSVARALSNDYICIYYINAETNRFTIYSHSDELIGGDVDFKGDDFFESNRRSAPIVVHPEDLKMFLEATDKAHLLAVLNERPTVTFDYRMLLNGAYRYVHMKATRMRDRRHGILIGVSDIDAQMQEKAAYEQARSSSVTYSHIAQALSKDYIKIYYVNLEDDSFIEYSSHNAAEDLALERQSEDFFSASRRDAQQAIYPEDLPRFLETFTKEMILGAFQLFGVYTLTYRLMVDGEPTYVNMKASRMAGDEKHIIIGVSNIDAQMKHQEALERVKEERITYERISALSGDYIAIYTVDPVTGQYNEYSSTSDYEGIGYEKAGDDFFEIARTNSTRSLYYEDLDLFLTTFTKENVLDTIARKGVFVLNYRLMIEGRPTYVSLKAGMIQEKDGPQLIVGVINIDEQVRRDQEYAQNLSIERNKANFDAMTGVKNKHAYVDVEYRLNRQIEEGEAIEFALVVCDVNGLKKINDTLGHQAGDRYLRRARTIICRNFKTSPVFRVGGDEFAVLMQGSDYDNAEEQVAALGEINRRNKAAGDVVIACGLARYDGDRSVAAVFERADARMYENKRMLEAD